MVFLNSMVGLFSNSRWMPNKPHTPLPPRDYSPSVCSTDTNPTVTITGRLDDLDDIDHAASPSPPSKSEMASISAALILLLRTWQHSATPSRIVPPTIAQGDEESDSDATCVATENESSDVKAGNVKRPSNFLSPPRKYPKAPKRLPGIPASD